MDFAYRLGNRNPVSPIQILSLSAPLLPDAPESSPRRVRLCSRVRSPLLPRSLTSIELENGAKRPQSVAFAGQSENSVAILLSGYSFVSLRHETMASITDSIS